MPSKSSPLDVLPCTLLNGCAAVFAPVIASARLANLSLQTGIFPSCFKRAQVLPLLKKSGLDTTSPANYKSISNLSTVSKVLERLVLARLPPHLLGSTNFSQFQSAYRKGLLWTTRPPMTNRSLFLMVLTVCCVRHSKPWHTAWALADWVWGDRNSTILVAVLPQQEVTVCQTRSPSVTSCQSHNFTAYTLNIRSILHSL